MKTNDYNELYNEIKDYTDEQLLGGIALAVMHRIYCKDMLAEAIKIQDNYKQIAKSLTETSAEDVQKCKCALEYALEIEHAYKELLLERGVIKMGSDVNKENSIVQK